MLRPTYVGGFHVGGQIRGFFCRRERHLRKKRFELTTPAAGLALAEGTTGQLPLPTARAFFGRAQDLLLIAAVSETETGRGKRGRGLIRPRPSAGPMVSRFLGRPS